MTASLSDRGLIVDIRNSPTWLPIMQALHRGIARVTDIATELGLPRELVFSEIDDLDYDGIVVICDDLETCRLSPRGHYLMDEMAKETA
jgi:predicted transcriptional regulator